MAIVVPDSAIRDNLNASTIWKVLYVLEKIYRIYLDDETFKNNKNVESIEILQPLRP